MKNRPRRRPLTAAFAGAAAGILLAGAGFVGLAGSPRWTRPARQAASALPVRSVIGLDAADVAFWPWEALDAAGTSQAPEADTLLEEDNVFSPEFVSALLGMGYQEAELDALNGACFYLQSPGQSCFYLRDLPFFAPPVHMVTEGAQPTGAIPLRAGLALGYRRERLALTLCAEAAGGYAGLPENWAPAAQQRALEELMYLVNLSSDSRRAHLYDHLQAIFAAAEALPATPIFDSQQQLLWRMSGKKQLLQRLEKLAWLLRYAQECSVNSYSRHGFDDAARRTGGLHAPQPLDADSPPPQTALLTALTQVGLDVQLIPLEHQLLILFSWESGNLGVYYDPLLDHFQGFALQ